MWIQIFKRVLYKISIIFVENTQGVFIIESSLEWFSITFDRARILQLYGSNCGIEHVLFLGKIPRFMVNNCK